MCVGSNDLFKEGGNVLCSLGLEMMKGHVLRKVLMDFVLFPQLGTAREPGEIGEDGVL